MGIMEVVVAATVGLVAICVFVLRAAIRHPQTEIEMERQRYLLGGTPNVPYRKGS